jgi:hypothetical protein
MAFFIQMFRFAVEPFFLERAKYSDARETYAFKMRYFIIAMLIVFLGIISYKIEFSILLAKIIRTQYS